LPGGELEATRLRGSALFDRRQLSQTRQMLEVALRRWPEDIPLLQTFSYVLLEDGEHESAERVLLELLRLSPGNSEARHNLELLRRRMQVAPDLIFTRDLDLG